MSENRPIEKLLKEYAQRRQSEAGPTGEIHPATRRLLQAEVRRTYPQATKSQPWYKSLFLAWPRLLPALGLFLLLGVITWSMLGPQTDDPTTLAANDNPSKDTPLPTAQPLAPTTDASGAAIPESAPIEVSLTAESQKSSPGNVTKDLADPALPPSPIKAKAAITAAGQPTPRSLMLTAPAAPEVTTAPASLSGEAAINGPPSKPDRVAEPKRVDQAAPTQAKAKVTDATRPAIDPTAPTWSHTTLFTNHTDEQHLTAIYRDIPATNGFLTSFTVHQTSNTVQFVDADGSVYSGNLSTPQTLAMKSSAVRRRAIEKQEDRDNLNLASDWIMSPKFFSLSGTNLTLNKQIIISGTLAVANAATNTVVLEGNLLQPDPQPTAITGTAYFSPTETIQIKAQSVIRNQ